MSKQTTYRLHYTGPRHDFIVVSESNTQWVLQRIDDDEFLIISKYDHELIPS